MKLTSRKKLTLTRSNSSLTCYRNRKKKYIRCLTKMLSSKSRLKRSNKRKGLSWENLCKPCLSMTKRLVSVTRQTCCKTPNTSLIRTMWACKLELDTTSLNNLLLRRKLKEKDEIKVLMPSLSTILQIPIYLWLSLMSLVYRRTDLRGKGDRRHNSLTWITQWSRSTRTLHSCK